LKSFYTALGTSSIFAPVALSILVTG